MTSEYDKLRCIKQEAPKDKRLIALATWLFTICVEQANRAKDGWNFEKWKKNWTARLYLEDWQQKAEFLDDCHSVLSHQGVEAFDMQTLKLIDVIYNVFEGETDVYDVGKLTKRFPDLPKHLTALGYKPTDKRGWMWTKT